MLFGSRLLTLIGRLIVSLFLTTALFASVAPQYNWLVVQISDRLLALLEHPYRRTIVTADGADALISLRTPSKDEAATPIARGNREEYYNLVLLLTLFLSTPGLTLPKRIKLTLGALGSLFLFHVVGLTAVAEWLSNSPTEPLLVYTFMKPAFPVLLWGLLTFKYWFPLPSPAKNRNPNGARPGPNAACPCGSGRKFKICCGKLG